MRILQYTLLTVALVGFVFLGFLSLILLWDADVAARPGTGAAPLSEIAARHNDTWTATPARFKAQIALSAIGVVGCAIGIWWLDRKGKKVDL